MPHSKGFGRRADRRTPDLVSIGDVVDSLMEEDVFSRGMPIATLARRWPELVGERLARATQPASLEGGVLLIRASDGPWGAQARYLADQIRERAEMALGTGSVKSVRIVVTPSSEESGNRRSGR
jgi:hypothetical protein